MIIWGTRRSKKLSLPASFEVASFYYCITNYSTTLADYSTLSFLSHTVSMDRKSGSGLAGGCGSDSGSLRRSQSSHLYRGRTKRLDRQSNAGLHPAAQICMYRVLPQLLMPLGGAQLPCLLSNHGLKQGFHRYVALARYLLTARRKLVVGVYYPYCLHTAASGCLRRAGDNQDVSCDLSLVVVSQYFCTGLSCGSAVFCSVSVGVGDPVRCGYQEVASVGPSCILEAG